MGKTTGTHANEVIEELEAPRKRKAKAAKLDVLIDNAEQVVEMPKQRKAKAADLEGDARNIEEEDVKASKKSKHKSAVLDADAQAVEEQEEEVKASKKKKHKAAAKDAEAEVGKVAKQDKASVGMPVGMKASEARRLKKARKAAGAAEETSEKAMPPSTSGEVFVSFVGGMGPAFDREAFKTFFAECGEITDLRVPMREARKGREAAPRGIAFVTFASKKAVKRALARNQSEYNGRVLVVKKSKPKNDLAGDKTKAAKQDFTVFATNLPHAAAESDVRAYFRACGNIAGCRVVTHKGIAFVRYKREEGFQKALELNEKEFQGRAISVAKAQDSDGVPGKAHIGAEDDAIV